MHSHFTGLLDFKELSISNIENVQDDFFIYVQPTDYPQTCTQCQGTAIIRKDYAYQRKVRHLLARPLKNVIFSVVSFIREGLFCYAISISKSPVAIDSPAFADIFFTTPSNGA